MLKLCIKEDYSLDITKLFILDNNNIIIEYIINDARLSFNKSQLLKNLILDGFGYFYLENNDIVTITQSSIEIELFNMYIKYNLTLIEHEQFMQEMIQTLSKYVF